MPDELLSQVCSLLDRVHHLMDELNLLPRKYQFLYNTSLSLSDTKQDLIEKRMETKVQTYDNGAIFSSLDEKEIQHIKNQVTRIQSTLATHFPS